MLLLAGDRKGRAPDLPQRTQEVGIGKIAMSATLDIDKHFAIAGQRIVHRDLI